MFNTFASNTGRLAAPPQRLILKLASVYRPHDPLCRERVLFSTRTQNLKDSTHFQVRNMKATASHMALEKLINITTEIELRASKRIYKACVLNRSL